MKTIYDESIRNELIMRIQSLSETSISIWGKMNVYQMCRHCVLWEEMILGKKRYKRNVIGLLFGRMMLKNEMKDDSPMRQSTPTISAFIIKEENGELPLVKNRWIALIKEHELFLNHDFVHPFFGKMTKEQIGWHAYKHNDHHLRQFGA